MTRATGRDGLHDVLRRVGDLTRAEVARAGLRGRRRRRRCCAELRAASAARSALRLGGERALHRRRRGRPVPRRARRGAARAGCRRRSWRRCRTRCASWSRATPAPTGPFTTEELRERYGVDAGAVLRELERAGTLVRGELRPGGSEREWCDVEVLRRLRRASLAALRKEIEPADRAPPGGLPALLAGRRPPRPAPAPGSTACARCWCRCRGSRCRSRAGSATCSRAAPAPTRRSWLDELCASGELVWVGAGPLGRSGRVALYFREDAPAIGPPAARRRRRAAAGRAPSTS